MPKKSRKTKKSVKKLKSSSKPVVKHESLSIGKHLERWTNLKVTLHFSSDDEFLDHLLNLAELALSKSQGTHDEVNKIVQDQHSSNKDEEEFDLSNKEKPQSPPCKEEKRNYKKSLIFNNVKTKPVEDVTDTDVALDTNGLCSQGAEITTTNVCENTSDEEKENVGVFCTDSQARLAPDLNGTLTTDNVTKQTAEVEGIESSNSNDILKESEQNLDYLKVIKKHKKKRTNESHISNCIPLETLQNSSKHKKKKHSKHASELNGKLEGSISIPDSVDTKLCSRDAPLTSENNSCLIKTDAPELFSSPVISKTEFIEKSDVNKFNDTPVVSNNVTSNISDNENHRVSITIKLCCDCDSRHLQDGCPLRNPNKIIHDTVNLNNWLRSRSPDSQYRDEESLYESRQDFASVSLPDCLELKEFDAEHGLSVFAKQALPASTQFGPLIGQPIKEMEIPDDFSMKDIWEIIEDGKCNYISTQDPEYSNWIRWLRPAPVREARNLAPIQTNSQLYFVTTVSISEGDELLYWADHISSAWSNKKMTKTNCGGCNLRFIHPIYYRRHCAVFHDPKFSLTIRKYHCKVCGLSVLGKENIMKHAADEHDGKGAYQCQYCKKFFLRLNYLEMHRTYGCAANPHRTRPLCDYCGRKFCQPQKLKIHIKRMHSEISEVLKEFQCKRCMKVLGSRAALQRHIKEVHHKAMLGSCTCDKCGKMFQNKSNLKIHMLTHSGIKPFKCQEESCLAAFTTKQCLQFHYKKVHGFTEGRMPTIERSVAYTFDAYAGELRPGSADSNCSSSASNTGNSKDMDDVIPSSGRTNCDTFVTSTSSLPDKINNHDSLKFCFSDKSYGNTNSNNNKLIASKASKKWMGEDRSNDLFEFNEDPKDKDESMRKNEPVSMIFRHCKPESSNASLLVEAALDAAERDIEMSCNSGKLPSPTHHNKISPLYPIIQPNHLSPQNVDIIKSVTPNPPIDYQLHSVQDISPPVHIPSHPLDSTGYPSPISPTPRHTSGYGLLFPERTPHYELRLSPTSAQIDTFHLHPEDTRYDLHHRRLDVDCSSDDGDGVQNLSLGLKNKSSLQLDLSSSYNKYDHNIDDHTNTFVESSLEGLDMSRSSLYHHSNFVSMTRYPHTVYDQRSTYSHSDVLRVVNLTHSVDLSLPRTNHLTIPPHPNNQSLIEPIRVISPPSYQNYPLSQSPYLPATRATHSPTYHHYSGY